MLARIVALTILISSGVACAPSTTDESAAAELNDQGVARMGRYEYETAREHFMRSLELHDDPETRINLAIATLNRQHEGDEALALEILANVPAGNVRATFLTGLIHLYLGSTDPAVDSLEAVVAADPSDAYAAYFLGQAHLQRGAPDAAAPYLLEATRLDPWLRSAYWAGAQALKRLGRDDEATQLLATYERFEASPNARLADFAYRRMGPKADARPVNRAAPQPRARPAGPLFDGPIKLSSATDVSSLSAVDADAKGSPDLVTTSVNASTYYGQGDGAWIKTNELTGARGILWGDINNDGHVDFVACTAKGMVLWLRDDENWQQSAPESPDDCQDAILIDADHDGDLDILATGSSGTRIINNNADGTFRSLEQDDSAPGRQVIAADLDADRDLDIIIVGDRQNHVWRNDRTWRYEPFAGLEQFESAPLVAVTIADADIDGRPEIFGMTQTGSIVRWAWAGPHASWTRTALATGDDASVPKALAAIDVDGDRIPELIRTTSSGVDLVDIRSGSVMTRLSARGTQTALVASLSPGAGPSLVIAGERGVTLHPPGPGRHSFLTLSLSGRSEAEQMRSNASGIGTQVHARIGGNWAVMSRLDRASGPGQSLAPLSVGLAGLDHADYVELTWSDGVSQTEINLAGGTHHVIEETQRQLASCPVVFVWDGEQWRFVSDVLGVGGMGFFAEPGAYAPPRPFEFYLLDGDDLATRDGRLQLKLTEPMEEIAYLDTARIHVIDVPASWQLVLDERMGVAGPDVTGRTIAWREAAMPTRAVNDRGQDVTELISVADRRAAPVGPIDRRFIGLLDQQHSLTLEFSESLDAHPGAVLVADGWIEYPYSQTVFAAWQAGRRFEAATLEARDGDGTWHTIAPEFGYPAGMPRQMALPLDHVPAGTNALRLTSNMEIYWDRLMVAFEEPMPAASESTLSPITARVARTGFSKRTTGAQRLPHYDYADRSTYWDAKFQRGFYTAFGDAMPLVAEQDGAVAVIGGGEEVHLEFPAPPPHDSSDRRYYVLEFRGWAKDMDLYTRDGETVGPLPEPATLTAAQRAVRDELHRRYNVRFQEGL